MLDHKNPIKETRSGANVSDLTGQSFRDWTVDYFVYAKVGKNSRINYWMCTCKCGKKKEVSANNLRYGKSKGCGCSGRTPKDLVGKKFGKYIVESFSHKENGVSYWNAVDEEGNKKVMSNSHLHHLK